MYPKSLSTKEGLFVAGATIVFIKTNDDGTINWAETRATFSVFCNKKNGDKEYKDVYDISVKGKSLITTVASQLYPGKAIDRISCFESVEANGAIKKDKDGNPMRNAQNGYVYMGITHYHLQNIELGNDSEKMERKRLTAHLNGMAQQGNMVPGVDIEAIVNAVFICKKQKPKNTEITIDSISSGAFGNTKVWSNKLNNGAGGWVVTNGNTNLGKLGGDANNSALSQEDQDVLAKHHAEKAATAGADNVNQNQTLPDNDDIPF